MSTTQSPQRSTEAEVAAVSAAAARNSYIRAAQRRNSLSTVYRRLLPPLARSADSRSCLHLRVPLHRRPQSRRSSPIQRGLQRVPPTSINLGVRPVRPSVVFCYSIRRRSISVYRGRDGGRRPMPTPPHSPTASFSRRAKSARARAAAADAPSALRPKISDRASLKFRLLPLLRDCMMSTDCRPAAA